MNENGSPFCRGETENGSRNCKEQFSYLNFANFEIVGIVTLFGGVGKSWRPGLSCQAESAALVPGPPGTHHGAGKKIIIIRSIDLGNPFLG